MMSDQAFSAQKGSCSDTDSPSTSGQTSGKTNIFNSDTHVVNVLEKLRANKECDITLIGNDGIALDAHRLILAASSYYFAAQPVQVNIDGATLKLILDYMYSGKIELNSRNVGRVLRAAKQFQMGDLKSACHAFPSEELSHEMEKDKLIFIDYSNPEYFQLFSYNSDSDEMPIKVWCPNPQKGIYGYSVIFVENCIFKAGGIYSYKTIDSDCFECMDFRTMEWIAFPPMLEKIQRPLMAQTSGDVYVSDRCNKFFHKFNFSQTAWQWQRPLNFTPYDMLGYKGLVYAACYHIYHLEVYNPASNEWSATASRNKNVKEFRMVELNGYLYAIGGKTVHTERCSRKVERYCPSTDVWTVVKSLNTHLSNLHCCAYNGRLIACGTFDDVTCAEEYIPEIDEWKEFPPLLDMTLTHFSYLATMLKKEQIN